MSAKAKLGRVRQAVPTVDPTLLEFELTESLLMSLPLIPAYLLPLQLGSRLFARSSERQFRMMALLLCAFAALSGLPLWRMLIM